MLRNRAFDVGPEAAAHIAADIDRVADMLRKQWVRDADEAAIVAIVRHWSKADERLGPGAGTPHLDRLLLAARTRAYARATGRSGFMEQWANLYEDLFRELEGERLAEFQALAERSAMYIGPPGSAEAPENFWRTMGRKEAVAVWGILKGMGTSLAGTVDAGASGVTKLMRKAGLDVADPVAAAAWLAEQYDFVGNELIGREEWSEGEELFWGMNAAEVSTHGGEAIWLLVSMGRGDASRVGSQWTQAAKWAQVVEKGIGVSGNLMAVEQSANEIVALLEAQQRTHGQLVAASLLQDPAFHKALLRLVANAFGATAGDSDKAGRIGALLEGAQITPIVGQLIEIGTADLPTDEKKRRAGPVLMDLMKQVIAAAGAVKAAKPHSDGGNLPPEAEGVPKPPHQPPAEERAVLPKPKPEPEPFQAVAKFANAPVAETATPAKPVKSDETPEVRLERRMREMEQVELTPEQQRWLPWAPSRPPRITPVPAEVPSAAVIDAMQGQGVTRPEKRVGIEAALPVAQPPEIRAMAGGMRESPPSSGERVVIIEAPASQPTPASTADQPLSAAELESMRPAYTRMGPEDPAPVSEVTSPWDNRPDIVALDVPTATSATAVVKRPLGKAALPEPSVPAATAEQQPRLELATPRPEATKAISVNPAPADSPRVNVMEAAAAVSSGVTTQPIPRARTEGPDAPSPQKRYRNEQGQARWERRVSDFLEVDLSQQVQPLANDATGVVRPDAEPIRALRADEAPVAAKGKAPPEETWVATTPQNFEPPRVLPKPGEIAAADAAEYRQKARALHVEPGTLGMGWDHKRFPNAPKGAWKPGDPIDMPTSKGYPTWETIRKRAWRTLAHQETEARELGTAARDDSGLFDINPVRSASPEELKRMVEHGHARKDAEAEDANTSSFELEHQFIPQRVGALLEGAGLPPSLARQLSDLGNPQNLLPLLPALHAAWDNEAHSFGYRNKDLEASMDVRSDRPLISVRDDQALAMIAALKAHGVKLDASTEVGRTFMAENAARKNPWPLP
ncbi:MULTISPECIES: hypothetical protein [unclassified Cyanobium]|uniref:hypothetical protein n=1 Tax=unclassified Cyanobium TaxID=2627006 RepID=UPI0020CEF40A|nr:MULTISPECIES: hypothetical protein [unclassified Cyanobium]MCP9835690.1 hypothetical protein [Cyanobium sp. La Preciosa 7G6]MCP9938485.1 hypothetical protein [Cyanobium sp. Aljojuca 7A6]